MTNDKPDAVRVLEEALSSYSSEEPLAGLEQRVLNRVHAAYAPPRRRGWGWALTASVAAGVAAAGVAALVVMRPVPEPPRVPTVIAQSPKPEPLFATAQPVSKPPASHASQQLPKSREFPRPTPVTSSERALLALLERAPDATREAFLDFEKRSNQPIRVEEIKIEPLQSDGSQ
jgi:hypothetical protein